MTSREVEDGTRLWRGHSHHPIAPRPEELEGARHDDHVKATVETSVNLAVHDHYYQREYGSEHQRPKYGGKMHYKWSATKALAEAYGGPSGEQSQYDGKGPPPRDGYAWVERENGAWVRDETAGFSPMHLRSYRDKGVYGFWPSSFDRDVYGGGPPARRSYPYRPREEDLPDELEVQSARPFASDEHKGHPKYFGTPRMIAAGLPEGGAQEPAAGTYGWRGATTDQEDLEYSWVYGGDTVTGANFVQGYRNVVRPQFGHEPFERKQFTSGTKDLSQPIGGAYRNALVEDNPSIAARLESMGANKRRFHAIKNRPISVNQPMTKQETELKLGVNSAWDQRFPVFEDPLDMDYLLHPDHYLPSGSGPRKDDWDSPKLYPNLADGCDRLDVGNRAERLGVPKGAHLPESRRLPAPDFEYNDWAMRPRGAGQAQTQAKLRTIGSPTRLPLKQPPS